MNEPAFRFENERAGVDICCLDGVVLAKDKAVPKGVEGYRSGDAVRCEVNDLCGAEPVTLDVDANLLSSKSL